jgi:hypothetical protein
MYIFAKFVPDHIFLQNRDKIHIYIKKFENIKRRSERRQRVGEASLRLP